MVFACIKRVWEVGVDLDIEHYFEFGYGVGNSEGMPTTPPTRPSQT
jgi:hypothetical protein